LHIDPPFIPPSWASETNGGKQYRLYFFDGAGHITTSHEFFADNDEAAIKVAEGWREGRGMELWSRDRKVKGWP
jgi:hypothetical protein